MILANSLVEGFLQSNFIGQAIVVVQIVGSLAMWAAIIGKIRQLDFFNNATRRFQRELGTSNDVLEYYLRNRPSASTGIKGIYCATCERLLRLMTPDTRSLLSGHGEAASAALTQREIELVRGTCEHTLDESEIEVESGVGYITGVVALAPMLGLLGTVWGVLDAFAEMGTAGSASLPTIAPSISAALVTTVIGLLVAIPGVVGCGIVNAKSRKATNDLEGFADELMGRIACEFQGKGV